MKSFFVGLSCFWLIGAAVFVPRALAINIPDFPSCVSPTGTLKISYDTGVHGIVGNPNAMSGSDRVYLVGDSNLVQCFCATDGSGIQTNWWKQSSLTQDQIDQLQKDGWTFIPDGSAWGLENTAYLAKNANFSCLPQNHNDNNGGGNPPGAPVCDSAKPAAPQLLSVLRNGTTATVSWTAVATADHYSIVYGTTPGNYVYGVSNTGNVTSYTIGSLDPNATYYFSVRAINNCMPSDPSDNPGGQVLGASTFAGTGNIWAVYTALGLAGVFFVTAFLLKSREV